MKHLKTLVAIILAVPAAQAQLADDVYAEVNGMSIDEKTLETILDGNLAPPEQLIQIVEQLITAAVLSAHAEQEGFAAKDEVKLEIELMRQATLGRAYLQDYIANNTVTDAQVFAKFEELAAQQEEGKEYRTRHILVETEDEANDLVKQIDGNLDQFIELAKTTSIDTGSGANGGELGWSVPASYVPEFASVMTTQEVGTFSEPFQSQFGWHILYVDEVRDLPKPEFNDQIKQQLTQSMEQELVSAEIQRLKDAANISYNEEIFGDNTPQ